VLGWINPGGQPWQPKEFPVSTWLINKKHMRNIEKRPGDFFLLEKRIAKNDVIQNHVASQLLS